MFIIGNFILAVATVLKIALTLYMWIIIIAALVSWVSPDPYNPIVQFLYRVTEPVLSPIRRYITRYIPLAGIDISPIIAIFAIYFMNMFFVQTLIQIGYRLQ